MDKHNKHNKNRDKGVKKPQHLPSNSSIPQEQRAINVEETTLPKGKSKSSTDKHK
jgi:hypothetical protein